MSSGPTINVSGVSCFTNLWKEHFCLSLFAQCLVIGLLPRQFLLTHQICTRVFGLWRKTRGPEKIPKVEFDGPFCHHQLFSQSWLMVKLDLGSSSLMDKCFHRIVVRQKVEALLH